MKSKASGFNIKSIFTGLFLLTMLGACASLPENIDRRFSTAYTDTANTALGDSIKDDIAEHPGLSGFHLPSSGLDAFAARALLAYSAERGVRVRLLLDDMTLDDDKDIGVAAFDAHPQVEVRVFNPFVRKSARWTQILTRFDDVTRRMHNKSFSVDNQFTVVGGRNIGNEYFEADPDLAFGDLDVLVVEQLRID